MDKEKYAAAIALYKDSKTPVLITDGDFNALWSNRRLGEDEMRAICSRLALCKTLSENTLGLLSQSGSAHFTLGLYPLISDGITITQCGGGYVIFLMRAEHGLAAPYYVGSAARYDAAVRSALDGVTISAIAAQRAVENNDEQTSELFDNIRRGAYRVLRATSAATMFSRVLSGEYRIDPKLCDVGELLRRLCDGARGACDGAVISCETPEEPVIAELDVRFAERAILAVICNSLTFTRDGNEISVKLTRGAGRIIITIKDFGQGIKSELLPHVCEPYYSREPAADSDYAPSLGLGLTLAAYFCELHGGSLAINSVFGEGTTVALSVSDRPRSKPGDAVKAKLPNYVADRYSGVYIELCELCDIPH